MVFTEEDAENDGKVKREAGKDLHSVLARESGELYSKFREWCDENDRDPTKVIGDMILRGIKNEAYAENVAQTTIDLASLKRQQIREDDLRLVNQLINEFTEDEDNSRDPIDQLIEQRLQAIGSGPMSGLQQTVDGVAQNQQNNREVQRLEQKIESLEQQLKQNGDSADNVTQDDDPNEQTQESKKDIDELFGDSSRDEQDDNESESESETVVRVDSDTVSDTGVPDDVGPDVPDGISGDSGTGNVEETEEDVDEGNTLDDVDEGLEGSNEPTFSSEDADE